MGAQTQIVFKSFIKISIVYHRHNNHNYFTVIYHDLHQYII
jgi:hypothetical protein